MKVSILISGLIIVLLFYIIREVHPTFRQRGAFKVQQEAFGTSPGTMTQLAANHVPTAEDIPMLKQWMKDRQQGIWQITESDLVRNAPIEYSILGNRIGAFA